MKPILSNFRFQQLRLITQSNTLSKTLKFDESKGVLPPKGDPSWEWYEEMEVENNLKDIVEEPEEIQRGTYQNKFGKSGARMVEIPISLKTNIQKLIKEGSMEDIKHNALKIFTSYSSLLPTSNTITRAAKLIQKQHQRPNLPISKPHLLTYDKNETLAYIAAIMPGFYGCTHKVLSELQVRAPKLKPKRILDFGTGPGTSLWAAKDIFGSENIEYYHGVDLSEAMLETAEKLIKLNHDQEDSFKGKVRLERHFSYNPNEEKYDIVMAAYSLGELPSDILRQKAILELIERSRDTVVIIEKGTTRGFEIINQARELLNTNEMESCYILAPCPHSNICPKKGTTRWCHFEQKVQRPKFTMDAKSSKSNVEHSNYSYLIIQKGNKPEYIENAKNDQEWLNQSLYWSRILDHPKKKGSHVLMNLCDKDGNIYNSVFPSSQGKKIFRDARKSKRGDLFPHEPKTKTVIVDMKKNTIDLPKHKKEDSDLEE